MGSPGVFTSELRDQQQYEAAVLNYGFPDGGGGLALKYWEPSCPEHPTSDTCLGQVSPSLKQ